MAVGGGSDLSSDFRRFWWGEAVSGFGAAITGLALSTLVVVTLGGNAVEVGWLNSARWLPYLVLGLVVGALVDRARRRPVMIASDLVRAGLLGLIPAAWALDLLTFAVLSIIVVLFGVASLINDAASQSFVPRLVARGLLQRAHARLDGADAVAQTAGPAAAGVIIRLVGAPLAILVDAASYLFSAVMVASIRGVRDEPAGSTAVRGIRGVVADIREGTRWVYGHSGLGRLAVATHIWFAGQAILLVAIAPYAFLQLRLSPFQLGLIFAVAGIGALLGATVSTAVGRRIGPGAAIICAHLVSAAGVAIMVAAVSAPLGWASAVVLSIGQFGHGWAMGLSNSHEMSYRQALTPDALQARTNITMRSLNRAVLVVISPIAGLTADRLGFTVTLTGGVMIFLTSALILLASPFRRARIE